jgi:protein-histidine pros-kinase
LPEEIPRFLKQSVKFKTRKRDETFQDAGLWQHRAKDGRLLTVRAAWSIIDWDETKACMTCINDLTSETKAQKLQKEESKFRGLLEAAPDAMIIVDPGCTIALLNAQAEKLFGYSRAELLGQQMDLVVPESCRALHPQHHAGHFRDPHTWPMTAALELMGRRKDGSEFPSEIIFSPMEIGEDLLVTAVIRDVTERNHHADELESMRRQAEEANRLKSEFLANMSHELRTPLNSVIGFSELIYDGKAGPVTTNQKEYLGDVLTSARHLLQLINDILDLAKVEAGKIQFRPETLALGALIKEVCGNLRPIAEGKKIGVTVEITPGLGTVEADPGRLKQVLYNYLSNALKFTPQGGRVHVLARPEGGGFFHLAVQDTGVGIPSEDLGRLFVAFQQLDESASKKFQGTGLGLALTKKIVEAQGGHVGVESAPGQGTVFYADLPRKPL